MPHRTHAQKIQKKIIKFLEKGEQKIIKDEREPNMKAYAQSTLEINFRADFPAIIFLIVQVLVFSRYNEMKGALSNEHKRQAHKRSMPVAYPMYMSKSNISYIIECKFRTREYSFSNVCGVALPGRSVDDKVKSGPLGFSVNVHWP